MIQIFRDREDGLVQSREDGPVTQGLEFGQVASDPVSSNGPGNIKTQDIMFMFRLNMCSSLVPVRNSEKEPTRMNWLMQQKYAKEGIQYAEKLFGEILRMRPGTGNGHGFQGL